MILFNCQGVNGYLGTSFQKWGILVYYRQNIRRMKEMAFARVGKVAVYTTKKGIKVSIPKKKKKK